LKFVIASESEAIRLSLQGKNVLLRRFAPRNDGCVFPHSFGRTAETSSPAAMPTEATKRKTARRM
jgi:hypothetical protein